MGDRAYHSKKDGKYFLLIETVTQNGTPEGRADPLSMTDLCCAHATPLTSDKFWDKKIKD